MAPPSPSKVVKKKRDKRSDYAAEIAQRLNDDKWLSGVNALSERHVGHGILKTDEPFEGQAKVLVDSVRKVALSKVIEPKSTTELAAVLTYAYERRQGRGAKNRQEVSKADIDTILAMKNKKTHAYKAMMDEVAKKVSEANDAAVEDNSGDEMGEQSEDELTEKDATMNDNDDMAEQRKDESIVKDAAMNDNDDMAEQRKDESIEKDATMDDHDDMAEQRKDATMDDNDNDNDGEEE